MYHHTGTTGSHPKRRKKRPIHGIKSVEVTRGRSGYGFTISGQHPCVLSVIVPGSPAEIAGLKTGDYLVSVNYENVTKSAHDDVVRMVGMSTGTLTLQVAENYNSSDSSDDEYQHRSKARYPNRVRSRHPTGANKLGEKVLGECNQKDRHHGSVEYKHKDPYSSRQDLPLKSGTSRSRLNAPVGAENSFPDINPSHSTPQFAGPLSVERRGIPQPNSVLSTPALHHPLSKQAVVKSTTQSARSARQGPVGIQENHKSNRHNRTSVSPSLQSSNVTQGIASFLKTSAHHSHSANNAFIMMEEEDDVDGDDEESLLNCSFHDTRVVVGYIGSIEMPSDANKPHIRLQSIRSAVRRLRVEQKIHTLVLMDVSQDGVKLTNAMGTTVAHYPVDRLAFSGICPDDKRFFGIVTLHSNSTDDSSEDNGSQDEQTPSSGSCHVFMVDPEMRAHNIHAQKAKTFGINCTPARDRHQCSEFPRSATSVIVAITNLYKDRPGGMSTDNEVALSQAFADPSRAPQRSTSNSSNSDSGLGFGKDEAGQENVYVVDMPQAREQAQPKNCQAQTYHVPIGSIQHCSPGVQTMPTPMQGNQGHLSASCNIRTQLKRSTSIDDIPFVTPNEKFSVRAMPDSVHSLNAQASDILDKQNSAENLRASMQKLLQARDNHKSDQALSSDQESNSSKSDIFRSFSQPELQRPVSAPFRQFSEESSFSNVQNNVSKFEAVVIDNKKLSPRALLPPSFHQLRSPSAPPMVGSHVESDTDGDVEFSVENTSGMGSLIERFEHDHALRISSPADVSRRFSEGFALHHQREKDKVPDDGEKWLKPNTVRHRRLSKLQQPLSHSHESLVQLDHEISNHRLSSVGSVNNITCHESDDELKIEDIGRVAGWAVNFFKLLQDSGGLAVFTEFLKKEFSQENIIFWRIIEQYKKIDDSDKRKAKAKEIFTKHMSVKAADPINIEQNVRQLTEKQLDNPSSTTFDKPQLEIFKLMRQDSYPRFIKSELYKVYLMREMEGKPLNLPKDEFDGGQGKSKKEDKKKSKSKDKESEEKEKEKRRRSLLPWRQRNSKPNLKTTSDSEIKKHKEKEKEKMSTSATSVSKEVNNNTTQKKPPSGPGIDLSTMRKEVQANLKESKDKEVEEKNMKFCRVILPDGSTTVVCTKPGQNIRTVLGRLCDKRALSIAAVDVFFLGSDKPLDLAEDVSSLGSKEVIIERRVLFRMDLPNRKSIGVKAKPNRTVRDVFKPILNKYGFKLDSITVQLSGQTGCVDIDEQVSTIDNQRIVILPTDNIQAKDGSPSTSKRPPLVVKYPPDFHNSQTETTSLDMITNRIFEDLMKGKSSKMAHNFDDLGILDPELKVKAQQRGSDEPRSLGLFGLLRKESAYGKPTQDRTKMKTKNKVTFDLQKNETRKSEHDPEDDNFFDLLSKIQSDRYEDQRGLGTRASDVPAFLHKKMPHPSGRESAPPIMKQDHSKTPSENMFTDIDDYVKNDNEKFMSYTRGQVSSRPSSVPADCVGNSNLLTDSAADNIAHGNQSFSADGIYPSTDQAESVFQSTAPDSPDFDDPCLAEKGLRDIGFDYNYNMYQAKAWGYSRHRPNMSSRNLQSQSSMNVPMATPERYSFEESSFRETNNDIDKTLVSSPSERQGRPSSVPPTFGSDLNNVSPITPTNGVKNKTAVVGRLKNNLFIETPPRVEHSTPKSEHNTSHDANKLSHHSSPVQPDFSQKHSNDSSNAGDPNTSDKGMVVNVSDQEENVTFV